MNNIFKCVCKDDYEEPDCRPSKEYLVFMYVPFNSSMLTITTKVLKGKLSEK